MRLLVTFSFIVPYVLNYSSRISIYSIAVAALYAVIIFFSLGKIYIERNVKLLSVSKRLRIFLFIIATLLWFFVVFPNLNMSGHRFSNIGVAVNLVNYTLLVISILLLLAENDYFGTILSLMAVIYPLSIYSRSAAIPFFILGFIFLLRKRRFLVLLFLSLGVLVYLLVLGYRSHAGLIYLIPDLLSLLDALSSDTVRILFSSFSPYSSLEVFWEYVMKADVLIPKWNNVLFFLVYLLPFPGDWMSHERLVPFISLSEYIGVDESQFGLNSGLIAESFLWLGALAPLFLALFMRILGSYIRRRDSEISKLLLVIGLILFFLTSSIVPIRGCSRLLIYTLFVNEAFRSLLCFRLR